MLQVNYDSFEAPAKAKKGDAAYDIKAIMAASIPPGGRALIRSGLRVAIPDGYVGMVCSRSGLALKHGVCVLNAPGIIDPGYRGDVGVILCNTSDQYFDVRPGDRIAQLMFVQVEHPDFKFTQLSDDTPRGTSGFGSSGR